VRLGLVRGFQGGLGVYGQYILSLGIYNDDVFLYGGIDLPYME